MAKDFLDKHIEIMGLNKTESKKLMGNLKKKIAKINSAGLTGKCWQCGKKTFTHKASVITSTGLRELELCDTCHLYWGGD